MPVAMTSAVIAQVDPETGVIDLSHYGPDAQGGYSNMTPAQEAKAFGGQLYKSGSADGVTHTKGGVWNAGEYYHAPIAKPADGDDYTYTPPLIPRQWVPVAEHDEVLARLAELEERLLRVEQIITEWDGD